MTTRKFKIATTLASCAWCMFAVANSLAAEPAAPQDWSPSAREKISEALESPAKIHCVGRPLAQLLREIATDYEISVAIDFKSLSTTEVRDAVVTYESRGESLRAALQRILEPLEMAVVNTDDSLLLIDADWIAEHRTTTLYPVADLVVEEPLSDIQSAPVSRSATMLGHLLSTATGEREWIHESSPQGIFYYQGNLALRATDESHRTIEQTLKALRRFQNAASDSESSTKDSVPGLAPANSQIRRLLSNPATFQFDETPLHGVLAALEQQLQVPFRIDRRESPSGSEIDLAARLTFESPGISIHAALDQMLATEALRFVIEEDGILVTDQERIDKYPFPGIYDLADVLGRADSPEEQQFRREEFVRLVSKSLETRAWKSAHRIAFFGDCLLCVQTPAEHEQLRELLEMLRVARRENSANPKSSPTAELRVYSNLVAGVEFRPLSADELATLAELLQETVEPAGWKSRGGSYEIDTITRGLAVRAPGYVHDQIVQFLLRMAVQREQEPDQMRSNLRHSFKRD